MRPFARHTVVGLLLLTAGCARGKSGEGLGGGGPVIPPPGLTTFTPQAGLDCVAPGPGTLRIDFTPPPSDDFEVAAFVSTTRGSLFTSTPEVPAPGIFSLMVGGLTDGVRHFIGLGIRPVGGGAYEPIGPVLTATPGVILYVDSAAPTGGDGLTPATAYSDVFTAVLNGFVALLGDPTTSVNFWVAAGDYPINFTLPVAAGVNVYGGFGPDFDLATRDVEANQTILRVGPGQKALEAADAAGTSLAVILDGLIVAGNGTGAIGVETNSTNPCSLELRSVLVSGMSDRGIRVRNVLDRNFDFIATNIQSSQNGADGLNGTGAYDYIIYNSVFASNFQEGIDINRLEPETGGTATLNARSCQFFGNGAEGVDCTLTTPIFGAGGAYSVQLVGCTFERNAMAGCLVDGDFELVNGYSADILIRECTSRGNAGFGYHLDLDSPLDVTQHLTAHMHRLLATSNGLDGIYVTSESVPGFLEISSSAVVGNNGAALRFEGPFGLDGNCGVVATQCLLASNFGGGVISRDVRAAVSSTITYLQDDPFDARTLALGSVVSDDLADLAFLNAPEEYARVLSRSGPVLTLAASPGFPLSAKLELANDGTERVAASIAGSQVTLVEEPEDFGTPGLLSAFAPAAVGVDEDYRLGVGSIAAGAGLHGMDAGLFGALTTGVPGLTDPMPAPLLYPQRVSPPMAATVGPIEPLEIVFSRALDGASVNGATVIARRNGNPLSVALQASGNTLSILPPGGGWGSGEFVVELDGVAASDGTVLSSAVAIPFRP